MLWARKILHSIKRSLQSSRCVEGVWRVSGRCLKGVTKVLEDVWKVYKGCIEGSGEYKDSLLKARSRQDRCSKANQDRSTQDRTSQDGSSQDR